ncbi:MAG: glycoside hydrolase family 92 protein [Deltaproteobacteria bacterium]|nr:glycoside hydrolase family 92 protein [Deltaproteobacteria bacterium]
MATEAMTCGDEDVTPPTPFVPPATVDLVQYVDPMIGTGGSGNAIPGALVPHGMVRATPETDSEGGSVGVYGYDDTRINGFVHTSLEGPGGSANGYSEILVMPGVGEPNVEDPSSAYSHDDEDAEPGYYRVGLTDPGVEAELTASGLAAVHRYTFPARDDAWVLFDLGHTKGQSKNGSIEIVGDRTVRGFGTYQVHVWLGLIFGYRDPTGTATVYFHAEFSRPFSRFGTFGREGRSDGARTREGSKIGGWVGFDTTADPVVEVRVGISMLSAEQAKRNLDAEIGDATFETVRERARTAWNDKLNRIRIEADDATMTLFYTALYHSMFQPADYTEAGGCHAVATSGAAVVHGGGRPYYTDDWCMWDTYRTLHPLGTLLEPEIRGDVVQSMLDMAEDGGWLEKCSWHAAGYSRVMTGNPQIGIIADSWLKGLDDFDTEFAWSSMRKTSTEEIEPFYDGLCGYFGLGTPPEYLASGYVGHECDNTQAASMTLEIAYADFCMAEVAARTGRAADEASFRERAQNFRNQWNPAVGFMQSRRRDGTWVEPFDPADASDANGFVESTSWIFSFFVPHDVPALIELMGGEGPFVERLDRFFGEGHDDIGNEPGFHVPWLYNYAGASAKAQAEVRRLVGEHFTTAPDGLPGNDDSGAMSAWLVFAVLGLYPVAPGVPVYQISTPLVGRATLYLHPDFADGTTFTIETEGGPGDVYIQSATLAGEPLDRPYLRHDELTAGGTLHFVLGPEPSEWGSANPSR